jgi:hypothetical protein
VKHGKVTHWLPPSSKAPPTSFDQYISITENFTAAGPDGPPDGRSELMKGLGDTNVKITNAGIEDVNVRLYGPGQSV